MCHGPVCMPCGISCDSHLGELYADRAAVVDFALQSTREGRAFKSEIVAGSKVAVLILQRRFANPSVEPKASFGMDSFCFTSVSRDCAFVEKEWIEAKKITF